MIENNSMSNKSLELSVKIDLGELERIATEIEIFGEQHDWPVRWVTATNLALDELITNIVSYAFEGLETTENIRVSLTESDGTLTVVIRDHGVAFDPFSDAPVASLEDDIDDRRIGGLGIHFVTSLMDEVSYERQNGENRITLILHNSD